MLPLGKHFAHTITPLVPFPLSPRKSLKSSRVLEETTAQRGVDRGHLAHCQDVTQPGLSCTYHGSLAKGREEDPVGIGLLPTSSFSFSPFSSFPFSLSACLSVHLSLLSVSLHLGCLCAIQLPVGRSLSWRRMRPLISIPTPSHMEPRKY